MVRETNFYYIPVIIVLFLFSLNAFEYIGCNGLHPPIFTALPVGSIQPRGWMLDQLNVQANGMSMKVDEIWPDVAFSGWIGGWAEGWERFPYFMDGLVGLAVSTQNPILLKKLHAHVDYVLSHQQADGWLGPTNPRGNFGKGQYKSYDPWPVFVMLKSLAQYYEAFHDDRVISAMMKFLQKLYQQMDSKPLSEYEWAQYRWQDLSYVLHWLYDTTDKQYSWLLDMSKKACSQGYDWVQNFEDFKWKHKEIYGECNLECHGVNTAQGIKQGAVQYRELRDDKYKQNPLKAIQVLDQYHGVPSGVFTSDELLGGHSPTGATELCTVVEMMFSLEVSISNTGNPILGDRLEQIAFNALPSQFDPGMTYHQYVQQPNQIMCVATDKTNFTNVGGHAILYGVSPEYGCCTANYHQGWPKLLQYSWMRNTEDEDDGIVVVTFIPSETYIKIKNTPVRFILNTEYPFGDGSLQFIVKSESDVEFSIKFRIPSWSLNTTLTIVNDEQVLYPKNGQFYTYKRKWMASASYTLILKLDMAIRSSDQYHNGISIYRGPLLFSLGMKSENRYHPNCEPTECDDPFDYELTPRKEDAWNYGLILKDRKNPSISITSSTFPISSIPFLHDFPPVKLYVKARRIPQWRVDTTFQIAGELPYSPVNSTEPIENVELVPYGSTNLRVSVFPTLVPN